MLSWVYLVEVEAAKKFYDWWLKAGESNFLMEIDDLKHSHPLA